MAERDRKTSSQCVPHGESHGWEKPVGGCTSRMEGQGDFDVSIFSIAVPDRPARGRSL